MEVQSIAEKAIAKAKQLGSEKTMVVVSSTQAKEFNIEANKLTLLRTTFDQNLSVKSVIDQRQAISGGNQFTDEAMTSVAQDAIAAAKASPQDEGNGFAPAQGKKTFAFGDIPVNPDWMYSRLMEMLETRKQLFPKIILEGSTIKFVRTEKNLATSEGSHLSSTHGHYEGFVMFTAKDGKKSSSFNYISFNIAADQAGKPVALMKTSNLEELLRQSTEQTSVQKVPGKFDGEVIVTPHCMEDFIGGWSDFLGSGRMLKKSSFFQDKLGEKVASDKWTLSAQPVDSHFGSRKFWTSDGYLAENEMIFDKGVLRSYLLNHYAAIKLGQKASRSEGAYLKLNPGDKKLADMIAGVKKGVLMCRFSAGMPAENGDISGVAKNSYYIENGELKYPLGETMVSANLAKMLHDIQDVSAETVKSGYWELPWVRFSGVTVS